MMAARSRAKTGTSPPQPVPEPGPTLDGLVAGSRILLCCGSGGVGKTTTAAVLALHAARIGRRAVVVTIDPAKRLADALGLGPGGLSNEPSAVELDGVAGELWAMMLDTRTTFDAVVARYSATPEQATAITGNRFYRNIAGALSGTQEYMAAEKLYELHHDDRFDLVVVDTPPTRNALDFLDAPARLTRFLDHRVYRAVTAPTRLGLRVIGVATQLFLRPIARVVGGEVITDVVGFFQAFDGMEAGFRARAQTVIGLLSDAETHYVLVAAPRRDALAEAAYFAGKLHGNSLVVSAVVVNKLHPRFGPTTSADAFARAASARAGLSPMAEAWENLAELQQVAERERAALVPLLEQVGDATVADVPLLADDVHDLAGLGRIERSLFAPGPQGG